MDAASIPGGLIFWLSRFYSRLMSTAYGRPTVFRPAVWRLGLALGVIGAAILASLELWLCLILPGVLLGLATIGLAGWHRLMRPSQKTILAVISRLNPSTAGAFDTTVNHQLTVLDSLESNDLVHLVEGRRLSPIRRSEAEALIAASPARVVMYGEARVPGTRWLARGGILIDNSLATVDPDADRGIAIPARHEPFWDPDLELNALAGDFTAEHVKILQAEVVNLAVALRQ